MLFYNSVIMNNIYAITAMIPFNWGSPTLSIKEFH